jgi:phosphatidylserine/phosphatidylglycerophosphate/cardiolipin synthase-like enzyme
MNELSTIRQRIERASSYFSKLEGAVLTTFNLSATFLEENALPAVLGVEGKTVAARRAGLHQRLGATPCTVFYDPAVAPRISGRYRYVARPMPVRGRFFHPKLVIIAGRCENDTTWVYLAVSSANLTLSGWGRNAESFGETWIHTRRQQSWSALSDLLSWLSTFGSVGEKVADTDAVTRIQAALQRMPDRKRFVDDGTEPWSGSLHAELYASVVHKSGLPAFLQGDRTQRPSELWAYSPYWSEVADQVSAFNAQETVLLPALRLDRARLGLSQEQFAELDDHVEVCRNEQDIDARFWHMKAYWIKYRTTIRTAVGSCNFTGAGLSGGDGNVEAMLVFDADPEWLPEGHVVEVEELADEPQAEEEAPDPTPVAIVVAWDWRAHSWRWRLDAGGNQREFVLHLPGLAAFPTEPGIHTKPGKSPPRGATFAVTYQSDDGEQRWRGQVVELNLDHSSRTYGRSLTANEILQSWLGRAPTWDIGGGGGVGGDGDHPDDEIPAAFDAVNLYDFYRSMRALRKKMASLDEHPDIQRAYLVGRPDSLMALAQMADRDEEAPIVRYLVLLELWGVLTTWAHLLDPDLVTRVQQMAKQARNRTREHLLDELSSDKQKTDNMLDWFEQSLANMDREVAA